MAALLTPFTAGQYHIAAGTNYPEHGEEVNIDSPFLFPKLGAITPPFSAVARRDALLDYEVELALVLLADHPLDGTAPAALGLTIVNDLTDRERLVRGLNLLDIDSGAGFPDAKSRDGVLPVGSFLVIPRDWKTYSADLELELYVNGGLRQRSTTSAMIWSPEQIFREVAARQGRLLPYQGSTVPLAPPGGTLAARTIILTGTPEGVVFRPPTARQVMAGIPPYALSFAWSTRSPLDRYLAAAHASGAFLQPGDEVLLRAERLGLLRTTVAP
jgi:2-keto-4-pentenoate hydratase/2-oxohepta-3-ene-1,7-dioic acid hydratase in catechol pathway